MVRHIKKCLPCLHTAEVTGSSPVSPTRNIKRFEACGKRLEDCSSGRFVVFWVFASYRGQRIMASQRVAEGAAGCTWAWYNLQQRSLSTGTLAGSTGGLGVIPV